MATGPEHYRRAEELLYHAYHADITCEDQDGALRTAQVHATLGLAAATALGAGDLPAADWDAWREAASEHAKT